MGKRLSGALAPLMGPNMRALEPWAGRDPGDDAIQPPSHHSPGPTQPNKSLYLLSTYFLLCGSSLVNNTIALSYTDGGPAAQRGYVTCLR